MSDELARVTERVRQNRAALSDNNTAPRQAVAVSPLLTAAGFLPGDRVFDTVTGLEGIVIDGARENVVVPTAK